MLVELFMAEYHEPLDSLLEWSSGRIFAIWTLRNERARTLMALSGGDHHSAGSPGPAHPVLGPSTRRQKKQTVTSMDQLTKVMGIKPEPYPGITPFQK